MANRFDILWLRVKQEFPHAKIIPKNKSLLMKLAFWLVRHVLRQKANYSIGFVTTFSARMYVPDAFSEWSDIERYRILRHELQHMRQFHYWPFRFLGKIPILRFLNTFLMSFCYLFVFPAKITMRARFEREGYTQTMLTNVELGKLNPTDPMHVAHWMRKMEKTFTTGMYFYMARTNDGAQFAARTLKAIAEGNITNDRDRVDLDKAA